MKSNLDSRSRGLVVGLALILVFGFLTHVPAQANEVFERYTQAYAQATPISFAQLPQGADADLDQWQCQVVTPNVEAPQEYLSLPVVFKIESPQTTADFFCFAQVARDYYGSDRSYHLNPNTMLRSCLQLSTETSVAFLNQDGQPFSPAVQDPSAIYGQVTEDRAGEGELVAYTFRQFEEHILVWQRSATLEGAPTSEYYADCSKTATAAPAALPFLSEKMTPEARKKRELGAREVFVQSPTPGQRAQGKKHGPSLYSLTAREPRVGTRPRPQYFVGKNPLEQKMRDLKGPNVFFAGKWGANICGVNDKNTNCFHNGLKPVAPGKCIGGQPRGADANGRPWTLCSSEKPSAQARR